MLSHTHKAKIFMSHTHPQSHSIQSLTSLGNLTRDALGDAQLEPNCDGSFRRFISSRYSLSFFACQAPYISRERFKLYILISYVYVHLRRGRKHAHNSSKSTEDSVTMARTFSRMWSVAAVCLVFIIVLASLNVLRPAAITPTIVPEKEPLKADAADQKDIERPSLKPTFADVASSTSTEPTSELVATTRSTRPTASPVDATPNEDIAEPTLPIEPPPAAAPSAEPSNPSLPHDPFHPLAEAPHPGILSDPDTDNSNDILVANATDTDWTPAPPAPVTIPAGPPAPTETTKTLVMGRLKTEDTDWVAAKLPDWENAIYYVDLPHNETSPTGLRTSMNKAREAMPYLAYIVDNYPNFTDVNVFMHPHRMGMPQAWHNDARQHDAVHMINDLKLGTVLERGYVNLRCNNEVGCPDEIHPFRDPPLKEKDAEHAYPFFYSYFFNTTIDQMKEQIPIVATQCCAQFAVSKTELLKRPKSEYERYKTFLEETPYDDQTSGRVMEYMWHIIFGREAVHCENVFECWCAVYGRCTGVNRHRPPW